MKQFFFLGLFVLSSLCANAQQNWYDSLLNIVKTDKISLAEKIGAYHMITESYATHDMPNTYIYGMKGLALAQKAGDKKMIATFYRYIGSTYTYRAVYDTALIYQRMQIGIAEEIQNKNLLQYSNFGLANIYVRQGKLSLAIEYYLKSMSYYSKESNESATFREVLADLSKSFLFYSPHRTYILSLAHIGECYRRLSNPERALFYLTKAKDILELNQSLDPGCYSLIYTELGYVYFMQGNFDGALESQLKVLDRGELNQVMESNCKEALAKIYIAKKEYDKATECANDCMVLAKSLGDPFITVLSWNTFAEIYRSQGRYIECESAAMRAWNIDSTSLDSAPITALNLAYSNLFLGNKNKAEFFFKKNQAFYEQKSNKNFMEAIADMDVKYETEKKEIRIASLEKERQLYVWLGIAGVMLALSLGVVLWLKIRNSQKERQLVASNAVQEGEMGERERIAGELHDRLLGSLSAVKSEIDNTDLGNKLNGCIEEVRRISRDLMPLPLRNGIKTALEDFSAQFPNVRFHFFGQEKRVEKRLEFVLYCCANELVTNSIRHSGAKNINVQLVQGENHIALTVQDDGSGFDEKTVTKGVGLKSIQDRVASCCGKMNVFTSPNKGTETVIEINT